MRASASRGDRPPRPASRPPGHPRGRGHERAHPAAARPSPRCAARLSGDPRVVAVEPEARHQLRRVPNDPAMTQSTRCSATVYQWYLHRQGFPAAWDLSRGDGRRGRHHRLGHRLGPSRPRPKIKSAHDHDGDHHRHRRRGRPRHPRERARLRRARQRLRHRGRRARLPGRAREERPDQLERDRVARRRRTELGAGRDQHELRRRAPERRRDRGR